ncbi:MAG: FixH family protein [Mesorhizobium sp.]|nr:FixH family protein [Mesorhizobium sp.]MBN9241611.1 FixH family protein [Mesorhizobium sp.]MBN9274883.1 FixH family protein [Mesorhizobium sp.]
MASLWRYLLAVIGLAAALAGIVAAVYLHGAGQGPDLSLSKPTANGLFVASLRPQSGAVQQGLLQSWQLTLVARDGTPVENAAIDIAGGMPQHDHGLPTSPQVTGYLGQGHYRIDGVKFTMSGLWQLRLTISAAQGSDTVVFNIVP